MRPSISITLVNGLDGGGSPGPGSKRDGMGLLSSPLGTTLRTEGFSIGFDYLRFEGSTLSSSLSPPKLEIEETIGRGSCSVVQRARFVGNEEEDGDGRPPVALKIFPIRDAGRREMLVKELQVLVALDCDCLVRLVGAFFDVGDGTVTTVLEYMDKGSLADLLRLDDPNSPSKSPRSSPRPAPGGLPDAALASIAFQMLWGLSYLHYENMLHRDVKPANVLVNSDGRVKLSDFGISSRRRDGQDMNVTVVGTTRYMSPERLRARPYGTPSDVWSLGLVLLDCATGRSPFQAITSIVDLVQTIEETDMDDLIPSCASDGLREVLSGCLQKVPEKRVPAEILIASPWFASHGITGIDEAVSVLAPHIGNI